MSTIGSRKDLIAFAIRVVAIFVGLSVLTAIAGFVVRAVAPGFDLQTMQAIATNRNSTLTTVANILTLLGSFPILLPVAVAFVLLRRWKRPGDDLTLLVIAVGSAGLPTLVKLIVQRPRPSIEHLSHLVTLSFPSEHTTQAAAIYLAIASLLSLGDPRGWRAVGIAAAVMLAILVAWSRVYLAVHYPTDVIAGLLLGWSWAWLVFRVARPQLRAPSQSTLAALPAKA